MNTEALREAAILDYKAAAAGERVSFDYDYVFMETCIDAGYSMDEAVDAALQKFKLYMSQEAKLCKRIGKEIKANVKKKNYPEAIALAKKRLAHLENLLKRADEEIDDDEDFIISMESMAKSVIITMIVSAILVKVAEGIVPGSGWLLDAIKKGVSKVKIRAGKDGSFIREFIDPILTIAGISKMVSKPIASHKMKKWQKERDGDINREYNEGRPDTTTLSVSRVQAKTRFKRLIQAQKDEIRMLEEAQKLHNKPKNESIELDEAFSKGDKLELGITFGILLPLVGIKALSNARKARLEKKHKAAEAAENRRVSVEHAKKAIRDAKLIAQGKLKGNDAAESAADINALKFVGCPPNRVVEFLNALIAQGHDNTDYEEFADWHQNHHEENDEENKKLLELLDKYMDDPKYIIDVDSAASIVFYNAKSGKVHELSCTAPLETVSDFAEIYRKYRIPDWSYKTLKEASNGARNESVGLDEGTLSSLDPDTKNALVNFGFSTLLLASALGVRHFSKKRREALEKKQSKERARKASEAEMESLRSALLVAKGDISDAKATSIDKLKWARCSAENAEKYVKAKLAAKDDTIEQVIDEAESKDHPDTEMISTLKKYVNDPVSIIDVEGCYSITFYNAKTGKVHIVTFGKGEETEDFKTMYNKYVVSKDLCSYFDKKYAEMQKRSNKAIKENIEVVEEATILLKSGFTGTREEVLQEAKLKAAVRNELPDSNFGLPEDRKYPLNDAAHVKAAIKMFSHCPDDKKGKLAKRITAAMSKFGIDTKFKKDSPMYDYVSAKYRAE